MTNSVPSVISDFDLTSEQVSDIIELAIKMKKTPSDYAQVLAGKSIATLYEKPSLRTRVSFDVGINKLGGHAVYLDQQNGAMGKREDVADFGANLSCWCDAIVARVMDHQTLVTLKESASVPIVNSLCDLYHPCQALADFVTLTELFGDLKGKTLAYIGDGNNVTHSLMLTGAKLGVNIVVVTPEGHEVDGGIADQAATIAAQYGATISFTNDLTQVTNVDAVYGDTWISMGDNSNKQEILQKFAPYQINQQLMTQTNAQYFMHCQPAHRGEEVTGEVLDSTQSVILQQAENRMWAQNALLATLLK